MCDLFAIARILDGMMQKVNDGSITFFYLFSYKISKKVSFLKIFKRKSAKQKQGKDLEKMIFWKITLKKNDGSIYYSYIEKRECRMLTLQGYAGSVPGGKGR